MRRSAATASILIARGQSPVLDVGKGFDSMGIYVGPGAVPVPGHADQFWFYYFGTRRARSQHAG